MPKYLVQGSYTTEGAKGLLAEGGTSRRKAAEDLIKSAGGKIEAFYYSFGGDDVVLIVDFPDHVTASAVSLTVGAAGGVKLRTTVLITPEEVDQAAKKNVSYRPPGK